MPNIEIHGIRYGASSEAYPKLGTRIAELLRGAHYENDIVVTDYASSVVDLKGNDQPYLRLVAPRKSAAELEDIEKRSRSSRHSFNASLHSSSQNTGRTGFMPRDFSVRIIARLCSKSMFERFNARSSPTRIPVSGAKISVENLGHVKDVGSFKYCQHRFVIEFAIALNPLTRAVKVGLLQNP